MNPMGFIDYCGGGGGGGGPIWIVKILYGEGRYEFFRHPTGSDM